MLRAALATCARVHLVLLNQSEHRTTSNALRRRLEAHYPGLTVSVRRHPRILPAKTRSPLEQQLRADFGRRMAWDRLTLRRWQISNENELPKTFRRLMRDLAASGAYDVAYFNYLKMFDRRTARLCGRSVVDIHDLQVNRIRNDVAPRWHWALRPFGLALFARSERRRLRQADRILSISPVETRQIKRRIRGVRVRTVPMTLDRLPVRAAEATGETLVFVGSNSDANAASLVWFFEEVWPLVQAARPSAAVEIYGAVCRNTQVKTASAGTLAPERVTLCGFVDDTRDAYARAAVCLCPVTRGTGMKVKVIEALQHGRPVVGTSVAFEGIAAEDGVHALFADDPKGYADGVLRLLSDEALRDRIGAGGRTLFRRDHSFEAALRAFGDLWADLPLAPSRRPSRLGRLVAAGRAVLYKTARRAVRLMLRLGARAERALRGRARRAAHRLRAASG